MDASENLEKVPHDHMFSVIILGDQAVGKTSLIVKFVNNTFNEAYRVSIGLDFKNKKIRVGDRVIKLQIWDTAGQERFRTIAQTYYQKADAVIIAYDCTSNSSFGNLTTWASNINEHCK
jgi:Ras-related protein Rab-1A